MNGRWSAIKNITILLQCSGSNAGLCQEVRGSTSESMALAIGACAICEKLHSSRMARRSSHPFDLLAERFAQILADRVSAALPAASLPPPEGVRMRLRE